MTRLLRSNRPRLRPLGSHASAGPLARVLRARSEPALHPLPDPPIAPGQSHPPRPGQLHDAEVREQLGQGLELVRGAGTLDGQRLVRDVEDAHPEDLADLQDPGPRVPVGPDLDQADLTFDSVARLV